MKQLLLLPTWIPRVQYLTQIKFSIAEQIQDISFDQLDKVLTQKWETLKEAESIYLQILVNYL